MANNGYVQVPPNSTGGKVDCASLSVQGQTVVRQRIVIADPSHSANFATVINSALQVGGGVAVSGTAVVSGTVSLGAGAANIGTINNISASVVAQVTSLPANIGTVNNISAPVVLAAGANNIGTINNISASVTIQGNVNISTMPAVVLAAGTNNIGTIQAISATVNVARANTGTSISDNAAVSLGTASSVLVLAAGTRREARFYNAGSNPMALQAGTATFATAALILQPGDLWIEDTVPQTNFYGIAQTGATTATVQVVT